MHIRESAVYCRYWAWKLIAIERQEIQKVTGLHKFRWKSTGKVVPGQIHQAESLDLAKLSRKLPFRWKRQQMTVEERRGHEKSLISSLIRIKLTIPTNWFDSKFIPLKKDKAPISVGIVPVRRVCDICNQKLPVYYSSEPENPPVSNSMKWD